MKPRHLLALLICANLLAACYRQAEEPFQQIDSAEVVAEATVAGVGVDDAGGAATAVDDGEAATPGQYITPEPLPGQVEQPTVEPPTSDEAQPATLTLAPFERPTATQTFEEQLDPNDDCVYQVQAGNVLFRLALAWGTTYQAIMELNQLESEDLSIGQLLLIPDCAPAASDPGAPATPGAVLAPAGEDGSLEPAADLEPTATTRPEIHVVSAGETIESISLRYRVDVNELIALNELANRNQLNVGQELRLPAG